MRINKFFTDQGICSRREADRRIEAGRVRINDRVARLGDQVRSGDVVTCDGAVVPWGQTRVYIKYHKPIGVTTTSEPDVARNIIQEIGHPARIFPVGRLDKDSSGLILLTNDGDIVNDILRAEHGHEREYEVEVDRAMEPTFVQAMADGVEILGVRTRPCQVVQQSRRRFRIVLTEGRNRQIRRMCAKLGYQVVRLHRIRIMHITIGSLAVGEWKDLTTDELAVLMRRIGRRGAAREGRRQAKG